VKNQNGNFLVFAGVIRSFYVIDQKRKGKLFKKKREVRKEIKLEEEEKFFFWVG
jgi:hypothetical protein